MPGLLQISVLLLAALEPDGLASGQRAFQAGDYARAETEFRAYLKVNPNSAEAVSNLAAVLARREQLPEAIGLYQKALRLDPKLTPVHFNLAVAMMRASDFAGAASHLRSFLKAQPAESRAHQLLGLCLVETGAHAEALSELERALQDNPRDPSVRFSLAYAHARAGDPQRGEALLREVDLPRIQTRLIEAALETRRDRYPEARAIYEEVLREDPNSAQAWAALGRLALLENDDAKAIEALEKALKLAPYDAESTYQLGVLYDRAGRSAEGVSLLKKALTLRGGYADPHYQLGRIAFREKKYPEALRELQAAARIVPNQEAVRLLLARTYQALGRESEAKAEFATVRRIKAETVERDSQRISVEAVPKQP